MFHRRYNLVLAALLGPTVLLLSVASALLEVLGLPDVQCHFHGLEREHVAHVLFSTAAYLFEHGDVIADGHTVPGPDGQARWACRHEPALAAPERTVLDLDPDEAYSVKQPAQRGH